MSDTAPLFRKLNLGTHRTVHVLNMPDSFQSHLAALAHMNLQVSPRLKGPVSFALAFASTQKALDRVSAGLAGGVQGDAILWIAYPKGTSRRYQCEFSRDSGWIVLGAAGFEPVRRVAIDEDWTALRFHRVEHIKSMTREASRTHSRERRRKAQKK